MEQVEIKQATAVEQQEETLITQEFTNQAIHHNHEDGVPQLNKARILLYVSQFFAEFSEWVTQFGIVVWLATLDRDGSSLFLNSSYQATSQLFVLMLVPRLTRLIDDAAKPNVDATETASSSFNRSAFLTRVIAAQNSCGIFVVLCFAWTLQANQNAAGDDVDADVGGQDQVSVTSRSRGIMWAFSLVCIFVFGGIAEVLHKSYLVTIERDWIVVMASSSTHGETWLEQTNVALKQIHLMCVILGPAITGYIIESDGGVAWVGGVKLLALLVEYICLNRVYRLLPILQNDDQGSQSANNSDFRAVTNSNGQGEEIQINQHRKRCACTCLEDLRIFASQTVAWAGLGYALLFCNVLTFGGMMTAFLKSYYGMSWSAIGVLQGLSNLVGLCGTYVFSFSRRFMKVQQTAMWSIVWEFAFLSLAVSSVFMSSGSHTLSVGLIIAGVIPSRIGLWVNDISVTQLFQQAVPPHQRGRVGGTQKSLNSLFEFVPFILGMIYSDVQDFWILMVVGYVFVGIAVSMFFMKIYLPYRNSTHYAAAPGSELELNKTNLPEVS